MSARRLAEQAVISIQNQIRANILTALNDTSADRIVAATWPRALSYEPPRSYFIYEKAAAHECPAVFTIVNDISFRKQEKGANHINAMSNIDVEVLLEDRDAETLTLRCWRYQDALHEILDQSLLTSTDSKVKLSIEVNKARFSGVHSAATEKNPQTMFRMAVVLELNVQIFENF